MAVGVRNWCGAHLGPRRYRDPPVNSAKLNGMSHRAGSQPVIDRIEIVRSEDRDLLAKAVSHDRSGSVIGAKTSQRRAILLAASLRQLVSSEHFEVNSAESDFIARCRQNCPNSESSNACKSVISATQRDPGIDPIGNATRPDLSADLNAALRTQCLPMSGKPTARTAPSHYKLDRRQVD